MEARRKRLLSIIYVHKQFQITIMYIIYILQTSWTKSKAIVIFLTLPKLLLDFFIFKFFKSVLRIECILA